MVASMERRLLPMHRMLDYYTKETAAVQLAYGCDDICRSVVAEKPLAGTAANVSVPTVSTHSTLPGFRQPLWNFEIGHDEQVAVLPVGIRLDVQHRRAVLGVKSS